MPNGPLLLGKMFADIYKIFITLDMINYRRFKVEDQEKEILESLVSSLNIPKEEMMGWGQS